MPYTPPPVDQVEHFQAQVEKLAEYDSENRRRQEEIGYRIAEYPAQTTSQPR